jgi:peroxiredoxin
MKTLLTVAFFLSAINVFAQSSFSPVLPVDSPVLLSGTFGEIRSHHFHSGIDIRTGGVEGWNVRSIEKGVVRRIKISSYGNGKALYVEHPQGYTSVYCHLRVFSKKIQDLVDSIQRKQEFFELDTVFTGAGIPVEKSEMIALSGNSGGSEGPHLHFEIRDSKNEEPLNPELFYRGKILDSVSPVMGVIRLFVPSGLDGTFRVSQGKDTIEMEASRSCFYWTIQFSDDQTRKGNQNFPYEIELKENQNSWFHLKNDRFAFWQSRWVDGTVQYPKSEFQTVRIPALPGNRMPLLKTTNRAEYLCQLDTQWKHYSVRISDSRGNETRKVLTIRTPGMEHPADTFALLNTPISDKSLKNEGFEAFIPKEAQFETREEIAIYPGKNISKAVVAIMPLGIPFASPITVRVPKNQVPTELSRKLMFMVSDHQGKRTIVIPKITESDYIFSLRETGMIYWDIDTVSPELKSLFDENRVIYGGDTLKIQVKEMLSGIGSYRACIDNKWVLSEYEPRSNQFWIFIPKNIGMGNRVIQLKAWDTKGNASELKIKLRTMNHPEIGKAAPAFYGKNQKGEDISLDQFKGKKVLLYFYPKDDTPGCTAEACNLRDNYSTLTSAGWEVIGVSTDSVKSHDKFAVKFELPFHLLADEEKKTVEAYGVWIEKSMYGRKYMGTDRKSFIIDENGVLIKIIEKVDTKNHTQQVLDAVK